MTSWSRLLASSALAGGASGSRSTAGVAAVTLATRPGAPAQPDRLLGRTWVKAVAGLLAAQELVADKLPAAPSRLEPPGLASRLVGAAAAGAVLACRASEPGVPGQDEDPAGAGAGRPGLPLRIAACAVTSAGAAGATAWLGSQWRSWASARLGHDWIGAGLEDAAALTLAATAAFSRG